MTSPDRQVQLPHDVLHACVDAYRDAATPEVKEVFAPPFDHVNIHQYALHLWGRLDGKPVLPDFTCGSGSI